MGNALPTELGKAVDQALATREANDRIAEKAIARIQQQRKATATPPARTVAAKVVNIAARRAATAPRSTGLARLRTLFAGLPVIQVPEGNRFYGGAGRIEIPRAVAKEARSIVADPSTPAAVRQTVESTCGYGAIDRHLRDDVIRQIDRAIISSNGPEAA